MVEQYAMLRRVSRTFALSIEQLPRGPRDALTLAYLLLRVSDGIEDHPLLEPSAKAEMLGLWDEVLAGTGSVEELHRGLAPLDGANPEIAVGLRAGPLLERVAALPDGARGVVLQRVRETTRGMARWQLRGPRVETEADLDDYMHEVAGRVGYLITEVFAFHSPALRARREVLMQAGRQFGLGLQTVNIIRGLRADRQRGWIFVPHSFCARAGLAPEQLWDPEQLDRALEVVELLVEKAERHLRYGLRYVQAIPRRLHRIRLMCEWPLLFAARTLALSHGNPAVLRTEAKIARAEVRSIMRRSALWGWSNGWLEWYFGQLLPASPSPAALPQPENSLVHSA